MKRIEFYKLSWFRGQLFQFNEFYFNGGKCYRAFRLGPLYVRVYD